MDSGEDGATRGPASAMSVEEAWGLAQAEDDHVSPSMTADRADARCNHLVTTEVATYGRV